MGPGIFQAARVDITQLHQGSAGRPLQLSFPRGLRWNLWS